MARGKKGRGSRAAVWVILILLIVGLAGFGAVNFGGSINSIGKVGDREISVQRYARDLQGQIRAFSAQIGSNVTIAQAQAFGIDRAVLQQLVSTVALENEAAQMGLSAGDEEVRTQILSITSFQGIDGQFDREAYRFALERAGQNESEFEENLRAEIARTLLQGAVASGVTPPDVFVEALFNFIGERRSFTWATLGVDALQTPIAEPNDADLRAYYDANQADFMLPETRDITYVWLTPEMIVDTVEIDEVALRALYDDRIDDFVKPERRLVERLILGTAATAAKARLDAGEITFEDLVSERGLELADVDLGDVTRAELGDAGDPVFATGEPGVVGPVETELGAALFRVNAILAAQETTFEDARAELVDEFALDRARRLVGDDVERIDDLLAGGATLEELAAETDMRLGQIRWTADSNDEIAAYEAFRSAAASAETGDFPAVAQLDDGGVFALRVNEIIEPRVQSYENASGQVESGWRAAKTAAALLAQAKEVVAELETDDAAASGLDWAEASDVTRASFVPDAPENLLETVFEMTTGEVRAIPGETAAYVVRLTDIAAPDMEDPDVAAQRTQIEEATAQSIGADILRAYSGAIERQAGISLNQQAIAAVHTQFP